jgi:hypothetical protein
VLFHPPIIILEPFTDHELASRLFSESRLTELASLKQLVIPEAVYRLHNIYVKTHDVIPGQLQKSLDMATIIANNNNGLLDAFLTPSTPGSSSPMQEVEDNLFSDSRHSAQRSQPHITRLLSLFKDSALLMLKTGENLFDGPSDGIRSTRI